MYAASTKQPLSRSIVADGASQAVLEQDLETQFRNDMLAISALDESAKQHCLRQLKPVMGKFSSVVAKFVMDSRIMKTSQGRGAGRSEASIITKKTVPPPKRMFPSQGSAASPIATSAFANAKGYGVGVPVASRRRPGNSAHIADTEKWFCPLCRTGVKNCNQSIKQHKESQTHMELLQRMYFCETCSIYCDKTPVAIREHNASYDHGHQRRLDAEPDTRDGRALADKRRIENAGQVQQGAEKRSKK